MTRELLTSWTDYRLAVARLLNQAQSTICIYDEDLSQLGLESPALIEQIQRVLQLGGNTPRLRIAVRQAEGLRNHHPRLLKLLETYGHLIAAQQTGQEIAHLRDNILVIDEISGLIRFDKEQPRSKILIDESREIRPYFDKFNEIMATPGEIIRSGTLGL